MHRCPTKGLSSLGTKVGHLASSHVEATPTWPPFFIQCSLANSSCLTTCLLDRPPEVVSDENDFIEVRSKRQMLNNRREQREKEIKAKSRVAKPPRKSRSIPQSYLLCSIFSVLSFDSRKSFF